ncbi:MAG TPA: hypothetical protein PLP17_03390 [Oligoflexia bacterium]|nr:hypothetical protein [Oligoflexia bacterium]
MTNSIEQRAHTATKGDMAFYERISPVFCGKKFFIPPPSKTPDERIQQRLAWRNERSLYKRKSSLSGEDIISCFHADEPYPVYSRDEWWSDSWDALDYGREFDASRPVFPQFAELWRSVPRPPLVNNWAENSAYCNFADRNRNCYLITSANDNEDCCYSWCLVNCKNALDCTWTTDSELVYECVDCRNCYDLRFSHYCESASESAFLFDCRSVSHSLFCAGLRNKNNYLFNEPRTRAEIDAAYAALQGSRIRYEEAWQKFEKLKQELSPKRSRYILASDKVIGDHIFNSKNIHYGFDVYSTEDSAYLHDGLNARNCRDICFFDGVELCYYSTSLIGYGYRFTNFCRNSSDLLYCDNCHSCESCFGCAGLRNKHWCVLNRQYTKDSYERLCARIISRMQQDGEWGEFFPAQMSPFAYNETIAQEYYPLSGSQAAALGFRWRDEEDAASVRSCRSAPDSITEVDDVFIQEVLACADCGGRYKIILPELQFYRRMNLPIPGCCFKCRNKRRLALRPRRKLAARSCAKCHAQVWTSIALEQVVCETCYSLLTE